MKRRTLNIMMATLLCGCLTLRGQEPWSMDRCMAYAVEQNVAVRKQRFEVSSQQAELRAAYGAFLPTVGANVAGQFNWGRGIDPETNTYTNITTFNNGYSIYTSLTVFDGGQTVNQWKQARVARQQGLSELQKARDDKAVEVMQAFIDVAYTRQCVTLAEDKLAESRQTLKLAETQEELGIKGRPDVAQVEAQVAEDDYNLTHQRNLHEQAVLTLKQAMSYPVDEPLSIDTLVPEADVLGEAGQAEDIYAYALENNPLSLTSKLNVRNLQLHYQIAKGRLLPTVSVQAGISTSYFRNLSADAQAASFRSQLKNNRGEYVAATLSIPLFDGFQRAGSVRRARNEWKKARLDHEETLRTLHADIRQAVMDRDGYALEVVQMERKAEADRLAYEATRRKFEEGMTDAIDLQTNANRLLQSRVTLLQKRLLLVMKDRLVEYYKGGSLVNNK